MVRVLMIRPLAAGLPLCWFPGGANLLERLPAFAAAIAISPGLLRAG